MLDTPHIIQTEARHTACIYLKIPRAEIRTVMGPGIAELNEEVAAQGIAITGSWFTHHLQLNPAFFDFEICLPVASEVRAAGRMKPGVWPAMQMAHTVYRGGYEGLGAAWKEFDAWIWGQGLAPSQDLWECYVKGPESGSDPAGWQTELSRQLMGA